MFWKIHARRADHTEQCVLVVAGSRLEAIQSSGVPASRIRKVGRDYSRWFHEFASGIKISAYHQATLLSALAANAVSGQQLDDAFDEFLDGSRALQRRREQVMAHDLIADRLRELNFDKQAVLVVESGEGTPDFGKALLRAGQELLYRKKLLGGLKLSLAVPVLVFIVSLIGLFALPIYFAPLLNQAMGSGIKITTGKATEILLGIYYVGSSGWPWLLAAAVAIGIYRERVWTALSSRGPLSLVNEYFASLRGLSFLTLFMPLFRRGVPAERIIEMQLEYTSGRSRRVFKDMLEQSRRGVVFSRTLSRKHWPTVLVRSLSGFEDSRPEAKDDRLKMAQEILRERVNEITTRLSGALYVLGILISVGTTMLIFFGAFLPLNTATAV